MDVKASGEGNRSGMIQGCCHSAHILCSSLNAGRGIVLHSPHQEHRATKLILEVRGKGQEEQF